MQYTHKIIILLSTFLCIPYYAGDESYRKLTGHFSIPQKEIAYSTTELWKNVSGGWGYARGVPITMKVFNATFQPEITVGSLSLQQNIKQTVEVVQLQEKQAEEAWQAPWHPAARPNSQPELKTQIPNRQEEIRTQKIIEVPFKNTTVLIGVSLKGSHELFSKNIKGFISLMPFTGVLLERKDPKNDTWPTKVHPVASIEAGFQGILSERLDWVFSGKYIYHPTQGEPRVSVQLGGIYNF